MTVLTSTSAAGLVETGITESPEEQVLRLGKLAVSSGIRGLVCSPLEIRALRAVLPLGITLVTPGIRPRDAQTDDQSRVQTLPRQVPLFLSSVGRSSSPRTRSPRRGQSWRR